MVFDINEIKSHPDKKLLNHIEGVRENIKLINQSKLADLVAIFHDLGKINPNFQKKLNSESEVGNGYSHHAYLSAYVFFCIFGGSSENQKKLKQFLEWDREINRNDIIAITVLIAKHHSNLPDFLPKDPDGGGTSILSIDENKTLFKFINNTELLINEYVRCFMEVENFSQLINNPKVQETYLNKFVFKEIENSCPLDFFLDLQFAFSTLIQADKSDAANFDNFILRQQSELKFFCTHFKNRLDNYLSNLKQDSELNKLRTKIRIDAISKLSDKVPSKRVFELTAPTGSGKTLMLLTLAAEIINRTSAKRVIYGLPFLSITEQAESEVLKIFKGLENYIQRIDYKSENRRFEALQQKLDNKPDRETINELNLLEFQENTFSYPFVITTFVRIFETLLSNRNSELLKLPNFSNCIFLLDEIQSLPPRLYVFFVAYISRFCEKFNSYAIISTATQPNFNIPKWNDEAKKFFPFYEKPIPLLPLSYFSNELFNRYKIEIEKETINLCTLRDKILSENNSALVILNTIDDTKQLYKLLQKNIDSTELLLLNTHFTPKHRALKIYLAKRRLREKKRIILISTQLIEAGVDVDFPVVFRDFATVSSIVQSAGRCNRNGKLEEKGKVYLFTLINKKKNRSELIYQGLDKELLRFTKESFNMTSKNTYQEKDLLLVQKEFFNKINSEWYFAKHWKKDNMNVNKPDFDFLKDIRQCMFDKIGKFELIDKGTFGNEFQFYVPKNENDDKFEILLIKQKELVDMYRSKCDMLVIRSKKKEIKNHLKRMSNQIVVIRLKYNYQKEYLRGSDDCYFSLYKIHNNNYNFEEGIDLKEHECLI